MSRMRIILKLLCIIILVALAQSKCLAQDHINRKAFISIHSGLYLPSVSGFSETYHSPYAFINGISLGVPFTNEEIFFYLKAMYFQKSGTPITYHFEYNDLTGEFTTYTTQEGDVDYKQWLGNIGIQYNLSFNSTHIIIFNGGISLAKVSEKIRNSTDGFDTNGFGFTSFFVGIGYEKKILDALNLFSEFQYNLDLPILQELGFRFGGANFNVGVRYYFRQ